MDIGQQVVLQIGDLTKGHQPHIIENFYVNTFYLALARFFGTTYTT